MQPALLLLAGLAGGVLAQDPAPSEPATSAPTSSERAPSERAAPVFEDGMAQKVPAFADRSAWIRHDLWVETDFDCDGDGAPDRLHVDVTRPAQTETEGLRVPVIYESSPYFSGVSGGDRTYFWNPSHPLGETPPERPEPPPVVSTARRPIISDSLTRTWVPRGFAVVHSEAPGTGLSDGCPTIGGTFEVEAPRFVVDWLCGRARGYTEREGGEQVTAAWCTGKVGMTGVSYNGTLALAAASTGVEGLEAIIPIAPNTSYYEYYRANGLVRHPGGYMGEDSDVLYNFVNSGREERRAWCDEHVREARIEAGIDRVSGDWNEFWAASDLRSNLQDVRAATLCVHGLNDWNVMPSHSVDVFETLAEQGVPTKAYFHQGGHSDPSIRDLKNRWFTRFLYGVENGVEDGPRAFVVREGDRSGEGTAYADYPNPDAEVVRLQLAPGKDGANGLLGAEEGGGLETFVDDVTLTGAELARAEVSSHRLLYVTPELRAPVHVSGRPRLHITLAADRPAANLSAWLVALPWTDSRRTHEDLVTRGWADPQNRGRRETSAPLVPGEPVSFAFPLEPDDQVVPAGSRLGLMIFSSDRDFTLWPPPGTELTVDLSATHLELPVVGGRSAWSAAVGE